MTDSILTPMKSVDTDKLAKELKARYDAQPKIDHRDVDSLRGELNGLTVRMQFHEEKRDEGEARLSELGNRLVAKKDALNVAKDMVATRPALRVDIRDLQRAIEGINEEIVDMEKYRLRHSNIAADLAKKIKEWNKVNGARLKELEEQEKVLAKAGL